MRVGYYIPALVHGLEHAPIMLVGQLLIPHDLREAGSTTVQLGVVTRARHRLRRLTWLHRKWRACGRQMETNAYTRDCLGCIACYVNTGSTVVRLIFEQFDNFRHHYQH